MAVCTPSSEQFGSAFPGVKTRSLCGFVWAETAAGTVEVLHLLRQREYGNGRRFSLRQKLLQRRKQE